jgi:hypothetical protein
MHRHPEQHWQLVGGVRILNLQSLVELFERAYQRFYADLHKDSALRDRVLPVSKGLLTPVALTVHQPAVRNLLTLSPSLSASATFLP